MVTPTDANRLAVLAELTAKNTAAIVRLGERTAENTAAIARLEGRIAEQSIALQELRTDLRGLQGKIDKLVWAILGIGATIIVAMLGGGAALLIAMFQLINRLGG